MVSFMTAASTPSPPSHLSTVSHHLSKTAFYCWYILLGKLVQLFGYYCGDSWLFTIIVLELLHYVWCHENLKLHIYWCLQCIYFIESAYGVYFFSYRLAVAPPPSWWHGPLPTVTESPLLPIILSSLAVT